MAWHGVQRSLKSWPIHYIVYYPASNWLSRGVSIKYMSSTIENIRSLSQMMRAIGKEYFRDSHPTMTYVLWIGYKHPDIVCTLEDVEDQI
jgi:hypothetical protein